MYGEDGGRGVVRPKPKYLVKIIQMVDQGKISGLIGKRVLEQVYLEGGDPEVIVEEQKLAQVSDESELEKIIDAVISENPQEVNRYRAGEEKLLQFLTGQVMKKSKGKANPKRVGELLKPRLGK